MSITGSNYAYKGISLNNILTPTVSSHPNYLGMPNTDNSLNPIVTTLPISYTINSQPLTHLARYTDYYESTTITVANMLGATHFRAILIGQGGQGGGGGGGYFVILDGDTHYYSGRGGSNGGAGSAITISKTAINNNNIVLAISSSTLLDNKGATGGRNRNTTQIWGTNGTDGASGSSTTLTVVGGATYSAPGGAGGAGGVGVTGFTFNDLANPYVANPSPSSITQPIPNLSLNTPAYTPITYGNLETVTIVEQSQFNPVQTITITQNVGYGGRGGYGGSGVGKIGPTNPITTNMPQSGYKGGSGFVRIYWLYEL